MLRDADASIAVTVEGYRYSSAANAMRTRVYSVMRDVRRDHGFCSIVTSPSDSPDLKPRVNWAAFHETVKLSSGPGEGGEGGEGGGRGSRGVSFAPAPPPVAEAAAAAPPSSSAAPAAAAAAAQRISVNLHRNSMDVLRSDAAREASAASGAAVAASPPPPPPPAAAASSSSPSAPRPSAVTPSFTAAAAAAAAATAEATRAPPPEAGGGMLLPPGLDPDSTFRLRSEAAQGARAKLDASLFEAAAAREVPEAETTVEGVEPNPVTIAMRRFTSASSTSSPKRRSEGGEGAV